jgi:hypothetical protein
MAHHPDDDAGRLHLSEGDAKRPIAGRHGMRDAGHDVAHVIASLCREKFPLAALEPLPATVTPSDDTAVLCDARFQLA